MRYELISKDKPLFKANLHCHSTCSDGRCTPEELKAAYKSRGYSILAITDHEYLLDHSDLNDENFLTITGYEISVNELSDQPNQFRRTCHLNLLAKEPHNTKHVCFHPQYIWCGDKSLIPGLEYIGGLYERDYSPECVNDIIKTAKENGFLVSYNHPHWSLETNGNASGTKACMRWRFTIMAVIRWEYSNITHRLMTQCSAWANGFFVWQQMTTMTSDRLNTR